MTFWLLSLVLILSVITYFAVQRSVSSITRTPVWLLWLVMMTPALIWSGWTLVYGENTPPPPILVFGPFVGCTLLYWLLIQWGRIPPNSRSSAPSTSSVDTPDATRATPTAIAPEAAPTPRPIDKTEESHLQSCFPWSIFYIQNIEYRPQAVICRGQLRTSPDVAYETVRENIEAHFGDRFLVIFQEGFNGKPFFALVPNPQAQTTEPAKRPERLTRPGVALALLVATFFTTTLAGMSLAGLSAQTLSQVFTNPQLALAGVPYSLALMTILGVHESGHYFTAIAHRIRTTLPYFIPVPLFLGTFGAFIKIRSPIPNRKALFDIGIAGPLSGLIVTLPILAWGLANSEVVPIPDQPDGLNITALKPQVSILLLLFSKIALGSALTVETAIQMHPVAIAGFLGLIVTALNLMPVGQLDGGHIVHAMFGQRTGAIIGQVTRLLVLLLSWVQPDLLPWAILLFFMPVMDEPALNDVSELDNRRDLLGFLALGLLLLIILPAPQLLNQLLQL